MKKIPPKINFITIDEFKNSNYYNFPTSSDDNDPTSTSVTTNDLNFAISNVSLIVDSISSFKISEDWNNELNPMDQNSITWIKEACFLLLRYYANKGVDYLRGSGSMAQGGYSYTQNNPDDPLYIPPEVFRSIEIAGYYDTFISRNLSVEPRLYNSYWLKDSAGISITRGELESYAVARQLIQSANGIVIIQGNPYETSVLITLDPKVVAPLLIPYLPSQSELKFTLPLQKDSDNNVSLKYDPVYFDLNSNNQLSLLNSYNNTLSMNLLNNNNYPLLNTDNKTIFGAINELKESIKPITQKPLIISQVQGNGITYEDIYQNDDNKLVVSQFGLFENNADKLKLRISAGLVDNNNVHTNSYLSHLNEIAFRDNQFHIEYANTEAVGTVAVVSNKDPWVLVGSTSGPKIWNGVTFKSEYKYKVLVNWNIKTVSGNDDGVYYYFYCKVPNNDLIIDRFHASDGEGGYAILELAKYSSGINITISVNSATNDVDQGAILGVWERQY